MSFSLPAENPPTYPVLNEERNLPKIEETIPQHEDDTASCTFSSQTLSEFSENTCNSSTQSDVESPSPESVHLEGGWLKPSTKKMLENFKENEDPSYNDILELKRDLILVFIGCLHENTGAMWKHLQQILLIVAPFAEYLQSSEWKNEILHYLRRIYHQLTSKDEPKVDVDVISILKTLFPLLMKDIGDTPGFIAKPCLCEKVVPKFVASSTQEKSLKPLFGNDDENIFSTDFLNKGSFIITSKPLKMLDLNTSLVKVAYDIAAYESFWKNCLGLTAQAINVCLPEQAQHGCVIQKPEAKQTVEESLVISEVASRKRDKKVEEVSTMSGQEAVEYYSKCKYTRNQEHLYFNLAPSRHFRPYDLIPVPKYKLNKEFFLFTTFGILHVFEDLSSESQRLTDWQRDAVLWEATHSIPFFKNFLIYKMFQRWKSAKNYFAFLKTRDMVEKHLIFTMPLYQSALLQISMLFEELKAVNFLPFNTDKMYSLTDFQAALDFHRKKTGKYMDRFFRLCRILVNVVIGESFKYLNFCHHQMTKKNFLSKDSLYIKREKKEIRVKNYLKAKNETSHLGNFVLLVYQIIIENLHLICLNQVQCFVKNVLLQKVEQQHIGFLAVKLIFEEGRLAITSPLDVCKEFLTKTLTHCCSSLYAKIVPLDRPVSPPFNILKSPLDLGCSTSYTQKISMCITTFLQNNPRLVSKCDDTSKFNLPYTDHSDNSEETIKMNVQLESLYRDLPSKQDDNMGVASPEFFQTRDEVLQIIGKGFLGQYSPITIETLQDKAIQDPEFLKTLSIQEQLMDEAIADLNKYVSNCSWLECIYQFCKELEDNLVRLKTMPSEVIQKNLSILDMSREAVSCCSSISSDNGMLWLDCSEIRQYLVPWIDTISQQITNFVIKKSNENSVALHDLMAEISKALKEKPKNLAEFVDYVQLYRKHRNGTPHCKDEMEYTEDLYNIISLYFRELTNEEFRMNCILWKQWSAFQKLMTDTKNFVNTQIPLAIEESDEKFKKLEICVSTLHQKAMGGQFLDPLNPPSAMVNEIKEIRLQFQKNQESLINLNKWKKAISGESYDLSFLNGMVTEMDGRFDLWKYLRSTIEHTTEWKRMSFKKMNVNQTVEKIEEWNTAAQTLKSLLPSGDNVLKFWEEHLDNFLRPLPLLEVMSSSFLKPRHWQSMFDGMGAVYDMSKDYIVEELLSLKLDKHEQTIMSIYRKAVGEHDLEMRLKKMKSEWEQLRFKLWKFIPDSLKEITRSKMEQSFENHGKAAFKSVLSFRDDYYILTGIEELKMKLMDDTIILETMMSSSILGEMESEVEVLAAALHQIEEITHLWITAQNKWMYLIKVFEKENIVKEFKKQANTFEYSVHNRFKEWMRVVNIDPKVMSVCPKTMSEKDHRFLQGDNLRKMLQLIIKVMDNILKKLQQLLDKSRMDFTRLFFLSDDEVTDLLAVTDRPEQLVPSARKCFPGLLNIALRVSNQAKKASQMLTASELFVTNDKLETYAIIGEMDEILPLSSELLGPLKFNLQWFKDLEQALKDTMVDALTDCVRFRLEDLGIIPYYKEPMPFEFWINEFPVECVIIAESVAWEKQMRKCMEQKNTDALEDFKKTLISRIFYLNGLLQSLSQKFCSAGTKLRNYAVFTTLIAQTLNRRDLVQAILDSEGPMDNKCFEWKICLKHQMDYKPVLRAEPELDLTADLSLKRNKEEVNLTRSKTVVKTAYEMSQCRVTQLSVSTPYGYEYFGPKSGLTFLHNPLTDRAMLSLTQSLKNYQCATITGGSSIGKTDTVKEFARLYGQCLFTICCSHLLTCAHIVQYLTGLLTSGCWALFDNVNRIPTDVMYIVSQHLDHIQSALRDLQLVQNSQYTIRGQPKFDKKTDGLNGPLIRRNSLMTLHSLEKVVTSADTVAPVQRQRTVPHGYDDKGLMTFFADEWISERQRRNSIKEVINIRESKMYRRKKPPPLEYEHIKPSMLQSTADFTKLKQKAEYRQDILGHINFNGHFLQACASYGCFMTLNTDEKTSQNIPDCFRLLLRPFSLIQPDYEIIAQTYLYICSFHRPNQMAQKIVLFLKMFETWQPRKIQYSTSHLSCLMKILSAVKATMDNENLLLQANRRDSCALMTDEEKVIMKSIVKVLRPSLMEGEEMSQFVRTLRDVFRLAVPESSIQDIVLQEALKNFLKETYTDFSQGTLEKLVELYSCCGQSNRSTIICGPSGSGKSTMLRALVQTLNMLSYQMSGMDPEEERKKQKVIRGLSSSNVKSKKRLQLLRETIADFQPPLKIVDKLGLSEKYKKSCYPRIYTSTIYPCSMSPEEFIGQYNHNGWQTGLLCRELHRTSPSRTGNAFEYTDDVPKTFGYSQVWFIFDGPLHTSWCDPISGLFDASHTLVFPNGETFVLSEDTKIIMETDKLSTASPAMLSQCSVVFCNNNNFQWNIHFQAWKKEITFKPYMTEASLEILQCLAEDMIPPTLDFLQDKATIGANIWSNLAVENHEDSVVGLQETIAFLNLLSPLFDKYFVKLEPSVQNSTIISSLSMAEHLSRITKSKEDFRHRESARPSQDRLTINRQATSLTLSPEENIPFYQKKIKSLFVYAFIWGFGAALHEQDEVRFSSHIRNLLDIITYPVPFPSDGSVYDYWVNESNGTFSNWNEQPILKIKKTPSVYVLTPQFGRYSFLIDLMLDIQQPVLISGSVGIGKTEYVQTVVTSNRCMTNIRMSPIQSRTTILEELLLCEQRATETGRTFLKTSIVKDNSTKTTTKTQKPNLSHLVFIDDLSSARWENGSQPCLELLRQILNEEEFYDKDQQAQCNAQYLNFIAAMTSPTDLGTGLGNATHILSRRLGHLFFNITFHTPTTDQWTTVYSQAFQTFLDELPSAFQLQIIQQKLSQCLIQSTLELYNRVKKKFKPTLMHPYYTYTLHDVANIYTGLKCLTPRNTSILLKEFRKMELSYCCTSQQTQLEDFTDRQLSSAYSNLPLASIIVRLWIHECSRTLADRILDPDDKNWFWETMEDVLHKYVCRTSSKDLTTSESKPKDLEVDQAKTASRSSFTYIDINFDISSYDNEEEEEQGLDTAVLYSSTEADATESESSLDAALATNTPSVTSNPSATGFVPTTDTTHTTTAATTDTQVATDSLRVHNNKLLQDSTPTSNITIIRTSPDNKSTYEEFTYVPSPMQSATPMQIPSTTSYYTYHTKKSDEEFSLSMSEIKGPFKSIRNIYFTKYVYYLKDEPYLHTAYIEGTEEKLMSMITFTMKNYNEQYYPKWNLVPFKEALPRIICLTRALSRNRGHSISIIDSSQPSIQPTLCMFAAFLANVKVFRPDLTKSLSSSANEILKGCLKDAIHYITLMNKPAVLLVTDDVVNSCDLSYLVSIMVDGYCQNLYNDLNELRKLALELLGKNWKILTGSSIAGGRRTASIDDDDDDNDDDDDDDDDAEDYDDSSSDDEAEGDINDIDNSTPESDNSNYDTSNSSQFNSGSSNNKVGNHKNKTTANSSNNANSCNHQGSQLHSSNNNNVNDSNNALKTTSDITEFISKTKDVMSDSKPEINTRETKPKVYVRETKPKIYTRDAKYKFNVRERKPKFNLRESKPKLNVGNSKTKDDAGDSKTKDANAKANMNDSKCKLNTSLNKSKTKLNKTQKRIIKGKLDSGVNRPDHGSASKIRYTEQLARAIHKLHQHIENHLHIMFILSAKGYKQSVNYLHGCFEKYPAFLMNSCSIMVNPPLSTAAYQEMISQWFQEDKMQQLYIKHVANFEEPNEEIKISAAALTYLHQTSQVALRRQQICKNNSFPYFPLQYTRELVHLFQNITDDIIAKETKKLLSFGGAVYKVKEAYGRIDSYKSSLNHLVPRYNKLMEHVKLLTNDIRQLKQLYSDVNSEIKDCQNLLIDINKEVIDVNRIIETMFAGLNPIFEAALTTLQSINKKAWIEIKSYRQPPEPIKELLKAVCLLFQCPQNWEDGQVLLVDSNFINNLVYYDKSQITSEIFARLKGYLSNPEFTSKTMMQYSLAAVSVLEWLKAIYKYCRAQQLSAPYKDNLEKLKEKQIQIEDRLGELHRVSVLYKNQLKEDLQIYRGFMKKAKNLDNEIQILKKKVSEASNLMGNISEQHHMWQSEISKSKMNLHTAFGDGMVAAASVIYLGAFDDQTRSKIVEEWVQHFQQPNFADTTLKSLYPKYQSMSLSVSPSKKLEELPLPPNTSQNALSTSSSTTSSPESPVTSSCDHNSFSLQEYESMINSNEFAYGKDILDEKTNTDYDEMDDKISSNFDNEPFLMVRSAFRLQNVLSNYQELSDWKMNMNINDTRAIQNALMMNTIQMYHRTFWPLLVDPDKQAESWVRYLHAYAAKHKTSIVKTDSPSKQASRTPTPTRILSGLRNIASSNSPKRRLTRPRTPPSPKVHVKSKSPDVVPVQDTILMVEADDPKLEQKIRTALLQGFVVIVTLVEELPLNPFLRMLVSCHEAKEMEAGNKVLRHENTRIVCHPNFYMYLVLPIPFNICGYNFRALPLQEMNIIDLSLSNEAIMNELMHATLKADRGDFELQRLANERDILQRRQEMLNEFALFREKTMNLEGPLIEDKNILESLLACNGKMEKNRRFINETCSSDDEQLKELCEPYKPMVIRAATIFAAFEHLPNIHECYFVSFKMFLQMFVAALRSSDRGFSALDLKLRANELSVVTTTAIFQHLTTMMFEQHLTLFYLLVLLEMFYLSNAASTKEIGVFLHEFNTECLANVDNILPAKPSWISKEGWLKCFLLEKSVDAFSNLLQYLTSDQADKKWPEYFKNASVLVNRVPEENLKHLTVFQRAILWKFCCPERLSEVCYALVISQLGNVIPTKENYNIRNIYEQTNNTCPALFLLPSPGGHKDFDGSEGRLYADPVREVKRLAKEMKMGRYVYVVNCCGQVDVNSLLQCVDDCYRNGYWLVLNNYHMTSETLHNKLTAVFQLILSTYKKKKDASEKSEVVSDYFNVEEDREKNFRLWVTYTLHQAQRIPPAILIQNSLKVSCETVPNFLSTLTKCHRAVNFLLQKHKYNQRKLYKSRGNFTPFTTYTFDVAGFATIHAILLQQLCCTVPEKFPGPRPLIHWSLLDMAAMIDLAKPFLPLSNLQIISKLSTLLSSAYAGQCTNIHEVDHIQAVINDILTVFYLTNQHMPRMEDPSKDSMKTFKEESSAGSQTQMPFYQSSLMPTLLSAMTKSLIESLMSETPSIRRFIQSPLLRGVIANSNGITDVVCQLFGLPASARHNLVHHLSRLLSDQISRVSLWKDNPLFHKKDQAGAFNVPLAELVEKISQVLKACPATDPADVSTLYCLYPDENFIKLELQGFVETRQQIETHLAILRKYINKEILLCKKLKQVKEDLTLNKVPKCWLQNTYPTKNSLTDWIHSFRTNFRNLLPLSQNYTIFQKHDLAIFLRPDRLFYTYLQTYTRKTFRDISNIELFAMLQESEESIKDNNAVFIKNLVLCEAKWHNNKLQFIEQDFEDKLVDSEILPKHYTLMLRFRELDKTESRNVYYCPVILSSDFPNLMHANIIAEIPLPATRESVMFCGKGVYLKIIL